ASDEQLHSAQHDLGPAVVERHRTTRVGQRGPRAGRVSGVACIVRAAAKPGVGGEPFTHRAGQPPAEPGAPAEIGALVAFCRGATGGGGTVASTRDTISWAGMSSASAS